MTTIFECDIQLNAIVLNQCRQMLRFGSSQSGAQQRQRQQSSAKTAVGSGATDQQQHYQRSSGGGSSSNCNSKNKNSNCAPGVGGEQLINLDTNCFTFGSFDWSLTIVPLVVPSSASSASTSSHPTAAAASNDSQKAPSAPNSSTNQVNKSKSQQQHQNQSEQLQDVHQQQQQLEPVCRIYLNRLSGYDSLCRVKYRVILGHHQPGGAQSAEHVDSEQLDQISDCDGRIRGYQFRRTNILKLVSLRHASHNSGSNAAASGSGLGANCQQPSGGNYSGKHHHGHHHNHSHRSATGGVAAAGGGGGGGGAAGSSPSPIQLASSVDLRVHIEMFCANTISEAKVAINRKQNEPQVSNCSDRNKQVSSAVSLTSRVPPSLQPPPPITFNLNYN